MKLADGVDVDLGPRLVLRSYECGWILSDAPVRQADGRLDYGHASYFSRLEQALGHALDRHLRGSGATTLAELLAEARSFRAEMQRAVDGAGSPEARGGVGERAA